MTARGLVKAEVSTTLSSDLVAQITRLPFQPGQSFLQGDVLLEFDCRRLAAELKGAKAEVRAADVTVKENTQLKRFRAAGANELAIAVAGLDKARAHVQSLEIRMGQCAIQAPFKGRVAELLVDLYERPPSGEPLLSIVKTGAVFVDLIVPSDWVRWLSLDADFSFVVDETRTKHRARLRYIGAVVDPVSRTIQVSGQLLDADPDIRPGMSGSARFSIHGG